MPEKDEMKVTDKRVSEEETSSKEQKTDTKYAEAAKEFEASGPLPKVDMATFILSLSSSALVHMGEVPEPESGTIQTNLPLARHTIDVLAMLEEKTKGNLNSDEARLFRDILFELRMKYVQKSD